MADFNGNPHTPPWWPPNPFRPSVFAMSEKDLTDALPNPTTRTAVAGLLMRDGWTLAADAILACLLRHGAYHLDPQEAPAALRVVSRLLDGLANGDMHIRQGSTLHAELKAAETELKL